MKGDWIFEERRNMTCLKYDLFEIDSNIHMNGAKFTVETKHGKIDLLVPTGIYMYVCV